MSQRPGYNIRTKQGAVSSTPRATGDYPLIWGVNFDGQMDLTGFENWTSINMEPIEFTLDAPSSVSFQFHLSSYYTEQYPLFSGVYVDVSTSSITRTRGFVYNSMDFDHANPERGSSHASLGAAWTLPAGTHTVRVRGTGYNQGDFHGSLTMIVGPPTYIDYVYNPPV